jgi:hypothetical protein
VAIGGNNAAAPPMTAQEAERIRKEKYLKDLEDQIRLRNERIAQEKAKLEAEERRVSFVFRSHVFLMLLCRKTWRLSNIIHLAVWVLEHPYSIVKEKLFLKPQLFTSKLTAQSQLRPQ